MERILFCWSGGKDSALALYQIQKAQRYQVVALLTTITRDYDRVSMHGVPRTLVEQQARSLSLPLHKILISRTASNEEYDSKMAAALTGLKERGVSLVAFGDIFLQEVRQYRENNLAKLGMQGIFPLWGKNTRELSRLFITLGFKAIITCVNSQLLNKSFVGRAFDEHFLAELPTTVDPNGENGEFHSFVYDGPIFKQPIAYNLGEVVLRDSFYFCDLLPKKEPLTKPMKTQRGLLLKKSPLAFE